MKKLKRALSLLLVAMMLLSMFGYAEGEAPEAEVYMEAEPEPTPVPTPVPTPEPTPEPTQAPNEVPTEVPTPEPTAVSEVTEAPVIKDVPAQPEQSTIAPTAESEDVVPLPDAPKVIVADGWKYDERSKTLVIPYNAGDEKFAVEWQFAGNAAGFSLQSAVVVEDPTKEQRLELGFTPETRVELPVEKYLDDWYTLYITAILNDGTQIQEMQVFRLEMTPDVEDATNEPTTEPTVEPTAVPVIDTNPAPTVEPTEEPAPSIAVHIEKRANSSLQVVLCAVVETEVAGEISYRWQALDSVAYQDMLMSGVIPDVETLLQDIPDETEEILNPRDAFGDRFLNYCYRVVVTADGLEGISGQFKYEQGVIPVPTEEPETKNIPKTAEELAEYFDMTIEELAEMLGMTVEELMGMTEEEIAEIYQNLVDPYAIAVLSTANVPSASNRIFIYNQNCGNAAGGYNDGQQECRKLELATGNSKNWMGYWYDDQPKDSNSGCGIYAMAHAYQWLTGDKRTTSNAADLLRMFINSNIVPGNLDVSSNAPWKGNLDSKYGALLGAEPENKPSTEADWLALFAKGGVAILRIPGHYICAVGALSSSETGTGEMWLHIVDSSCGSTIWRLTKAGACAYGFVGHDKLTSDTGNGFWRGDEYYISLSSFRSAGMSIEAAYRPSKNQQGTTGSYWAAGYENCNYKITKAVTMRKIPFDSGEKGSSLSVGQTITSDAIVDNGTNYWVRVTAIDGKALSEKQYIFSGYSNKRIQSGNQYLQYVSASHGISWTGNNVTGVTHAQGNKRDLNGQITSNATIKTITAQLYSNGNKWGNPYKATVPYTRTENDKKYSLYASPIDLNTKFGTLPAGNCRLDFKVEYYTNRMSTATYTISSSFTVASTPSAPATTKVTGITLNQNKAELEFSQSVELYVTSVSPSNATNKNVTWETSDKTVVKIGTSSKGVYAWGLKEGTATVTCTAADGSGKYDSCTIKVNSPSTLQITGVDYPSTYRISSAGWILSHGTVSSNKTLKSIKSEIKNGSTVIDTYTQNLSGTRYDIKNMTSNVRFSKITKAGTYTWTLTATDSSGRSVSATMTFKAVTTGSTSVAGFYGEKYKEVLVTKITVPSPGTLNASIKETCGINPTIFPSNATNKNVKWVSKNTSIATVSSDGFVTAVGAGTTTITCTATDGSGVYGECTVVITEDKKVTGISLNKTTITLNKSKNETATLTATVSPSDAKNKNVTWTSSNKSVATVSSTGVVTPVAAGTATITCTAADGSGATKSCNVTVIVDTKVTKITLNPASLSIATRTWESDTATLTPTIIPSNATNKSVSWTSSKPAVATVSSTGVVTAKAKGTTVITCKAADGSGVTSTCTVTVRFECGGVHDFDTKGKCLKCDYVCDHSATSYHYLETVIKKESKPVRYNEYLHTINYTYDVYMITYCSDCGVEGLKEKLYSSVDSFERDMHDFWDENTGEDTRSKCAGCGAANPFLSGNKCKHAHIEKWTEMNYYAKSTYTSIDDKTHRRTGKLYDIEQCNDCGEIIRESAEYSGSIVEEHTYDFYDSASIAKGKYTCEDCGHTVTCKHPKAVVQTSVNYEDEAIEFYLNTGDEDHHDLARIQQCYWACATCGKWLDEENGYPSFDQLYTESQPHEYASGSNTCKLCGYVTCRNKHTYSKTASNAKHDAEGHWWVCSVCKHDVDYAKHTFNASGKCTACNYTCPHDGLEHGKSIESVVKYTAIDDRNHSKIVKKGNVCPDCGASIYSSTQTIITEAHTGYADGKCDACARVCVHAETNVETVATDTTYSNITSAAHTSVTVSTVRTTCLICGNVKDWTDTVRRQDVIHTFDDGVCVACGYTCTHAKIASSPETEFVEWLSTDGPTHTALNQITTTRNCSYCGAYIGTSVQEVQSKAEAHGYKNGVCDTCGITRPVIEEINIDSWDITLGINEKQTLSTAYSPTAIDDKVIYESSAPTIVSVSSTGQITALKVGSAVITARSMYGDAQDSITVTVAAAPTKITLNATSMTLGVNDTGYVMLKSITPANASSKLTYSSSNKNVATVDAYGNIVGKKAGTAKITVKTYNGKSATCTVTVKAAPSKVILSPASVTLSEGQSAKIKATLPKNTAASYAYEVISGEGHVDVDNGTVYAMQEGEATVRVTTHNGKNADYHVTILPAPTEVTLNTEDLLLGRGETFTLKPAIDQGQTTYTYVSSDTTIVKVSTAGKITAQKKNGTATITTVAHNGAATSINVTVVNAPSKVTLSAKSKSLGVKDTYVITANLPSGTASKLTASSSKTSVATVAVGEGPGEFVVTAKKAGTATITIKTFNGKKATCKITVKKAPTSVKLNAKTLVLAEKQTSTLKATLSSGSSGSYTFRAENGTGAVSVAGNGVVTAERTGTAKVIVETYNGKIAECEVTILPEPTSIYLDTYAVTLGVKETLTLKPSVNAESQSNYTYSSDAAAIASVSSSGKIMAKKAGKVTITVTSHNGLTAKCEVEVISAPSKVSVSTASKTLGVNETFILKASIPAGTASKLSASSSKSSIATVTVGNAPGEFVVTAKKAGTATITVKTFNGKKATCKVIVKKKPTSGKLNKTEATIGVNESVKLSVTLSPSGSYGNVAWESSNPAVATVSGGTVKGVSTGKTTITATVYSLDVLRCEVEVKNAPTVDNASLQAVKSAVGVGESTKLSVNFSNAAGAVKSYKSSNTKIATVSSAGVVKGVSKGAVVITATMYNDVKITTTINILAAPSKVSFKEASKTIKVGDVIQLMPDIQLGKDGEVCSGSVSFTSNKPGFAKVNAATGEVTAITPGTTTITVTTQNKKTAKITIKVIAAE